MRGSVWFVPQREKKTSEGCFVSHSKQPNILPHIIIFIGKIGKTIWDLNTLPGTQKKAWMYNDLMKVWTEETWLKHTEAECKRLGFAII